MVMAIKSFISYWREIAIGIICGALFFITFSWWGQTAEIGRLKTQLNFAGEQNAALLDKINAHEKADQEAAERQKQSSKDREIIISQLTKEINKIRTQPVPKDCAGAIDYGIKLKDDFKWPEKGL